MKKKLEDYLPFYIWCDVMTGDKRIAIKCQLAGVEYDYAVVDHPTKGRLVTIVQNIQLLLRPLSDIKERDYHDIAEELEINTASVYTWLDRALVKGDFFATTVRLVNALRKREFDCDRLIEAGLAIDKTKL